MIEPGALAPRPTDSKTVLTVLSPRHAVVLMATYNGAGWIAGQCDSILAQRGVEVELVVSDDGSTDGTLAHLQGRSSLTLLPTLPGSGSAGKNFFRLIRDAEIGKAGFVAFADQDDVWDSDKLERACQALLATASDGYSSAVRAIFPDGRVHRLMQSPQVTAIDYFFEGAGQGCTFVIRRELFLRVRETVRSLFDQVGRVHYHDWLIYALCRSWGGRWHFDPEPSMAYRQHGNNELGARSGRAAIERRLGLVKSGWYDRQVGVVFDVLSIAAPNASSAAFGARRAGRTTAAGRLAWSWLLMRQGRRRLVDRLVLAMAAIAGHV